MISFHCKQDSPQTMLILTNEYKNESVNDSNAVYKLVSAVLHVFTFSDGSAYNEPNSVNLWNQQTYHKAHTFHFIDHVQTCIIVTNNSGSAKNNNAKLHY